MRRQLVLILVAAVAFGDCLRGSFHFDDFGILTDRAVTDPDGFLHIWNLLQVRPLTQLSFWINYRTAGVDAAPFHLINLLLHLAIVLLLFHVLRQLIPAEAAFLAAALFAVHPMQSEAVAYIWARGTLLATLFCLLCWKFWISGKPWLSVVCFGLALLCKEECVTFPFVLVLFGPRRWKPFGAMIALALAVGLRTLYATYALPRTGAGFSAGITPLAYFSAQGAVILRYLGLCVVPWGFTIDPAVNTPAWMRAVAWIWVLGAVAVAVRLRGKWLWFAAGMILLIASSSIFPAADLAADRRMYLPMIAFCALAGLLLWQTPLWTRVAIIAVLAALSIGRMQVWRTETSLWQEAVIRAPKKVRPRIQLSRNIPPEDALAVLRPLAPDAEVSAERGRVYLLLHRPEDALGEFNTARTFDPGNAYVLNNSGVARMALGQRDAARADFERALSIDPDLSDARENLRRISPARKP